MMILVMLQLNWGGNDVEHVKSTLGASCDDDAEGDYDGGDVKHVDDTGEDDGDDDDVSDIKHDDDDDAVDGGERHLDTVMGAAGEATENTLSGMGGQQLVDTIVMIVNIDFVKIKGQ